MLGGLPERDPAGSHCTYEPRLSAGELQTARYGGEHNPAVYRVEHRFEAGERPTRNELGAVRLAPARKPPSALIRNRNCRAVFGLACFSPLDDRLRQFLKKRFLGARRIQSCDRLARVAAFTDQRVNRNLTQEWNVHLLGG